MPPPLVLIVDAEEPSARIRGYVLESAGFQVDRASTLATARTLLEKKPILVACDVHFLNESGEWFHEEIRQTVPQSKIIALTDSPYSEAPPNVDRVFVKLNGPQALILAVDELIGTHYRRHRELQGDCVVIVNSKRQYIEVSKEACDLVGYTREEMLGKKIENFSIKPDSEVSSQFERFLKDRNQQGIYMLRHKNGRPIPIRFKALVLSDGCLAASWEPLEPNSNAAD